MKAFLGIVIMSSVLVFMFIMCGISILESLVVLILIILFFFGAALIVSSN